MDVLDSGLYIDDKRLYDYAAASARLLKPGVTRSGGAAAGTLKAGYEEIRRTHREIQRRYGDLPSPPAACEWLLDNWYMVQREYISASLALRRARRLRRAGDGLLITELCQALLKSGQGAVTEERCRLFLDGFQSVTVLRRAELDIFPAALRAALIRAIAAVCGKMRYAAETGEHAAAFEALFTTLRLFSVLDAEKLINSADVTNAVLAADPSGEYGNMDAGTRLSYLRRVEKMARREGLEEHVFARRLIKKAKADGRHVGFYLFPETEGRWAGLYIAAIVLLTLFLSLLPAFMLDSIPAALLLLLPVSELVKSVLDFILLHVTAPRRLPRMDTEKGLPPGGRTICVISALLTDENAAASMARRLELLRRCCKCGGVSFGLLADLPGADRFEAEGDETILSAARSAVNALNRKYGGGFYLFTRPRSFDGECWTGRERKRGAITALARLLCDLSSELSVTGDRDALCGVNYILTLDSDTWVYPGSVEELIGAALHPLNRPVFDEKRRVVTRGHAIIHPRMDTELKSANATDFALIFAGAGGCDPYGSLCGELYMNAFGSGGFAGKGIIDARAFIKCTLDRFPEGHVLSHDALEGACLRGAYMGDTEFSDTFPARPLAYYKRLHRWIRGDWQNLPWVFSRDFAAMDRFRLLDSLRRSLLPPMTLFALVFGFFLPEGGLALAAWAALLALLSSLFLSLAESGARRREKVRLRRYTRLLTGVGGAMVRTFIRLWLLPFEAWVCLSAIAMALWRMLVSHKRLLQWQTAQQSEGGAEGLRAHLRAMWFSLPLGLLLLLFSPAIIGKSAGLMWLLSPLAAAALALPAHREAVLSGADREFLLNAARENFRYLTEFSTALDNYLPPDNFQEQPPVGLAHRSSPTNIGLAAAAAAAAMDMGIIEAGEAAKYIGRIVSSLEKMPRALGHFYNWYDTRTLAPLSPAFISTVDSGNLFAGLMTAGLAMEEAGRPELAERIKKLLEPMDFSPLYDQNRGLFHICYDTAKNRGAGGWYDLMASEAMLTSYIAVSRGDVPVKHWRRLSRAQLQKDGFRGLASWTGTMFEYLMPALFLPYERGSLLYESGRFCVYAQKRRAFAGKPWGISESAFYSFDPALNYRYKANGCPALALKRGQEADMVISPYSSFLALAIEPQAAVRNLHSLRRFGASGRFGYMEALDFSPSRCRSDSGEKVRCYMAHHIGMSVIAAANALCEGSIRQRFLSQSAMAAHSLLLQERLPADGLIIRRELAEPQEKPPRNPEGFWSLRGGVQDRQLHCALMSNGAYNIIAGSQGQSCALFGRLSIYGAPCLPMEGAPRLELIRRGELMPLLPARQPELWELSEDQCRWTLNRDGLSCTSTLAAAAGDWGELRCAELRAERDEELILRLSFRPILAEYGDYSDHRAFWKLGIHAEREGGALLLRRLRRGDRREIWLCLCCDTPVELPATTASGWLSEPFAELRAPLSLKGGESRLVRFALCLGLSRREALEGAGRILSGADRGNLPGAAAMKLGMSAAEIGAAMELLPALLSPVCHAAPRRELWPFGISGDLPILCCRADAAECLPLLRRFCLLKSCGAECELVYLSAEQGEYRQPLRRRVNEALAALGLEELAGSRGGVHFVPLSAAEIIESRAAVAIGRPRRERESLRLPAFGAPREPGAVPICHWKDSGFEYYVNQSLPARAWQQLLTNGRFGCIVSDCGMGLMWLENAREMRLNPPPEDIRAVSGSEALWVETEKGPVSLFAANDGYPCRVSYSPGLARWEKEAEGRTLNLTAFVPIGQDARVYMINGAAGMTLKWGLKPSLGARDASSLRCRFEDGAFIAENPEAYLPGTVLLAGASSPCSCRTEFCPPAMLMSVRTEDTTVLVCGCISRGELKALCDPEAARLALARAEKRWQQLLSRFSCRTGVAYLDRYMNHWAAYQSIACRLEGRASLYQSGGAFGFRDQLQDAVNMLLLTPEFARERILDACRHQYEEGDVMHWWHPHPEGSRGIRSHCSDDLLWLCWALCEYVEATGDRALCAVEVPYLSSPPLSPGQRDRYETPEISTKSAPVLFHARAALDCCAARGFGPRGLPFMGSGDWNDGLDATKGESLWLGWFLADCAGRFADLLDALGKPKADNYRALAHNAARAADLAFNGSFYPRGFLPDGSPLGGESRIDSLPQSWAVLSGCAPKGRAERAVRAALRRLVDEKQGLVKLFDPPFTAAEPYPGYIVSYGEGFRENGGQYTHAAVWLAMACFKLGQADEGWNLLNLLLPGGRDQSRYEAEPFVLAADVYSAPGHEGEAGWSWYTGSAAWYFRAVTECMLGLRLKDGLLYLSPNLPAALSSCRFDWRDGGGTVHHISIEEGAVTVDGEKYLGGPLGRLK